jgi:hypothetical protein
VIVVHIFDCRDFFMITVLCCNSFKGVGESRGLKPVERLAVNSLVKGAASSLAVCTVSTSAVGVLY